VIESLSDGAIEGTLPFKYEGQPAHPHLGRVRDRIVGLTIADFRLKKRSALSRQQKGGRVLTDG